MTPQTAAALVGGIEHDPGKPEIARPLDQREVQSLIGEHHKDDAPPAPRFVGEHLKAGLAVAPGKQTDLDDVDAEPGGPRHRRGDSPGHHRQIPDRGTDGAPTGDPRDDGADRLSRQRAQGARRRILEIDQVGAGSQHEFRLLDRGHARQHSRHRPVTFSLCALCAPMRSISQSQACRSRGPAVLSIAICK